MEHSVLSFSGAPIWGNCSGAIRANAYQPDISSEESEQGTAAHWVASEILTAKDVKLASDFIGAIAPNGVIITEDDTAAVQVYVNDVLKTVNDCGGGQLMLVEKRMEAPQIHAACGGTPDMVLTLLSQGRLIVWEYKHGHGRVHAKGNLQLACQLAGVVNYMGIDGHKEQQLTAETRVVQPRCYDGLGPIRKYEAPLSDYRQTWNKLEVKAIESVEGPQLLTAGAHCKHCKAKLTCPANAEYVGNLLDVVDQPFMTESRTAKDLAIERYLLSGGLGVLKKRIEEIEADLMQRIADGEKGSKLAIGIKDGRRVWKPEVKPDVVIAMAAQFGGDAAKQDIKTVAQSIQSVPAAMREFFRQAIEGMHSQTKTKILIDESDTIGARVFGEK